MKNKLLLVVLDGWGVRASNKGNAIAQAHLPHFHYLKEKGFYTTLKASGEHVGLLPNYMGNSEVGHLHLGAGRLIKQDLTRISEDIESKKFFKNKVLRTAMDRAKGHSVHLIGLLSDAGVHSHIDHLFALIDLACSMKVQSLYVHCFLDGRDTPPKSSEKFILQVEKKLKSCNKNWCIASLMGRFYAMDRDNRWHREHKAYDAMVNCKGFFYKTALEALNAAYVRGETDEFVRPSIIGTKTCNVKHHDAVVFFNFRSDRARELTRAFVQGKFNMFKRKRLINLHFVTLTQYDEGVKCEVAYPPQIINNTLGEILGKHKIPQLRLAETEKWAHVTYFFNGLCGCIFPYEDRILIPSSRKFPTYDRIPRMKARELTETTIKNMKKDKYGFILLNFANADMVGHTGNLNKTIDAVEIVDECLGKIYEASQRLGYDLVVTADHGNAEQKLLKDGSPSTAHTTNDVPLIIVSKKKIAFKKRKNASLCDVAPVILELLGISSKMVKRLV